MLNRYFCIILLIVSASFASDDCVNNTGDKCTRYVSDSLMAEGKSCEDKIFDALSFFTQVFGKIDNMDKKLSERLEATNRKMDDLEKSIFKKLHDIENKFEDFKNQTAFNLNSLAGSNSQTLPKPTDEINELNNKIANLEENLNRKLTGLEQIIPGMEENMKTNLNVLNIKIQEEFEQSTNLTLDTIRMYKTNNIGCDKIIDVNYEEYKPVFRMDSEILNHVVVRNKSDDLKYFEMHFAVKAAKHGLIRLSSVPDPKPETTDIYFEIDIGASVNTWTHIHLNGAKVHEIHTLNILSPSQFTAFYVKVDNDKLEFGKDIDSVPIISYSDTRLRKLKYFSFSTYVIDGATFLFDCPSNFKMLATPCYSIT